MRIDDVPDGEIEPEPDGGSDATFWAKIVALREASELFLDFPAPDPDAPNQDREEDERVIRQQVQGAVAMAQAALNVLAAHVFRLYGDPGEGDPE
jgi:hypothetical protein